MPEAIRTVFGRPSLTADEIIQYNADEQMPPTLDEISTFLEPGTDLSSGGELYPLSVVWPMGFAWSSFIAQSCMVDSAAELNWPKLQILEDEGVQATAENPSMTIATDDVLLFQRGPEAGFTSEDSCYSLNDLDKVWEMRNVVGQPAKAFDNLRNCTCLGINMHEGTGLAPKGERIKSLALAAIDLDFGRVTTPKGLQSFLGLLTWNDLLARPLLS